MTRSCSQALRNVRLRTRELDSRDQHTRRETSRRQILELFLEQLQQLIWKFQNLTRNTGSQNPRESRWGIVEGLAGGGEGGIELIGWYFIELFDS